MLVAPHVLEFSSDDPAAARTLPALYHAAPATAAPPTLRYAIRRVGDDLYEGVCPSRPPFGPASLADVWAFVEWRAIEDVLNDPGPDAVFVHAAGVQIAGRLLLLVGPSGSGKSTIAAILVSRGNSALGDDVLRFAPSKCLFFPVPRSFKLDIKDLSLLALDNKKVPPEQLGTFLAHSTVYVSPVALCTRWEATPGRPWGLVLLDPGPHGGPAKLERSSEGAAAVRLVQSAMGATFGPGEQARGAASVRLLESLSESAAYQASGAGPSTLADLIEEVART